MLRRQRTFFLTSNQYEPVMLEYVGVATGQIRYRFKVYDDATRYIIKYRQSGDGGRTWYAWTETQELQLSPAQDGYQYIFYNASEGLMYETCVIMTGDDKDPSDESNIVTTIYPRQPVQSPPVLTVYPFYYDGRPYPFLLPAEMPSGVSSFLIWQREFGSSEWQMVGVSNAWSAIIKKGTTPDWTEPGGKYQYIIAWYDSTNGYIISDISNIATVELPLASVDYLLPPINCGTEFQDRSGQGYARDYYNALTVGRGDMRNEGYRVEYRRSSVGTWTSLGDTAIPAEYINDLITYVIFGHAETPIAGEVWDYRLKGYATGLTDSAWSEVFSITIPSFLPKLASPTITLQQSGFSVLIGLSPVTDSQGFKIERRSSDDSNWTVLQSSLSPSATSYTDLGTSYGNTYYYRVTALGDNLNYQDSNPTMQSITVYQQVTLPAPVIDSLTESGVDIVVVVSNILTANTTRVGIELSENNGSWREVGWGLPATQEQTSFTTTIDGTKIEEGGSLRFRAKAYQGAMATGDSPYSEIESITIDRREWLLKWNGSSWDYCTSVTGGWYSPAITDSVHTTPSGAIVPQNQGNGVLRLCGANNTLVEGWYMTQANLTGPNTPLTSKYKKVCVIGSLIKSQAGQNYHAWFGTAYTYTFSGGIAVDTSRGTRVIAGSDSGQGYAGTLTNPQVNACGTSNRATAIGSHVYFYFNGGYADIKGILAIKQ